MCGIFGYLGNNSESINQDKIIASLKHRGPDDEGVFTDCNLLLVHLRLAIVDLTTNGHQPMIADDDEHVICFNGEIYNHLELRKQLIDDHNVSFKSESDTETLLYGYKYWGADVLHKLNGIFAFIIYNKSTRKLFIARDHFGIKPLYIYQNKGEIAFSSEIKSFLELPRFDKTVNETSFINYVNFLWSPGNITPFKNVTKLLAGHYMVVDGVTGATSTFKYYEIPFNGLYNASSEEELINILDEKLQAAVKRQLMSDVPIAFFLSGGLDSSLLVAIAKKITSHERIQTYTIDTSVLSNTEGFADDLTYAKMVARYLDVDLKIVAADVEIVKDFDKMIYHLDEPLADAAPLNVMNICAQAKADGFKVMIGGTAGDDVFSGYRRHQALSAEKFFNLLPLSIRKFLKFFSSKLNAGHPTHRRIKKMLAEADLPVLERLAGYYNWLPPVELKKLFKRSIHADQHPGKYLIDLLSSIPGEKSMLNQMLFWELKTFLPDHNLNYTDKMSMAVGVEVRVPFLDIDLVNFAATLPPHLKMKGSETKYLLKKVAERYLPKEIIYRSKSGFGAPVRTWIVNDLQGKIDELLSKERLEEQNIFNYNAVKELIKNNKDQKIDASYLIWSLLAIQTWMDIFVKK